MRTDKELGAVRIMESLSGVSEELLERCEKVDKATAPKEGKKRWYVYRYALACAACLCLIVVGTAYYGLNHMGRGGAKSGSPQLSEGAGSDGQMNGMAAPMDAKEPADAADTAPARDVPVGEALGNGNPIEEFCDSLEPGTEPQWLDVSTLAALPRERETESEQKENNTSSANQETIRLETATQPEAVTRLETAKVPEGYSPVQADSDGGIVEADGMEGPQVRRWSDGEHSLWLKITQTGLTADMRFETEPPVYTVQEDWQELIPGAGTDGYIQFALLYEDGTLAEYCGTLDREEIIGLMESLVR